MGLAKKCCKPEFDEGYLFNGQYFVRLTITIKQACWSAPYNTASNYRCR